MRWTWSFRFLPAEFHKSSTQCHDIMTTIVTSHQSSSRSILRHTTVLAFGLALRDIEYVIALKDANALDIPNHIQQSSLKPSDHKFLEKCIKTLLASVDSPAQESLLQSEARMIT